MLRRLAPLLALMLSLCLGTAALAGGWPREAGGWFLSTTSVLPQATGWRPSGTEVNAEYGWRPRLTLVAALAWSSGYDRLDLGLRWHPPDLPLGLNRGLTASMRHAPRRAAPVQAHLGLELGHGRALGTASLWLDAGLHLRGGQIPVGFKVGVSPLARIGLQHGRWIGMLGVTRDQNRFASLTRLRPALYCRLGHLNLVAEGDATQCLSTP